MTEKRLVEILIDNRLSRGYVGDEMSETIKEAMKQAVNEAVQECADKVDKYGPYLYQNGGTNVLLNLKVK